jgi:hypothetical protein
MNNPLYLFCGGPAIDAEGRPKPLMKISDHRSLLVHYLAYLKHHRQAMPTRVTLLCDDHQEAAIKADIGDLWYPVPIHIMPCGQQPNTFEKFCHALHQSAVGEELVQFGYPDIFSFDEIANPWEAMLTSEASVYISAVALTSRFPRLIIDVYNKKVQGISNYLSPVPANPLYVFGGDLWGSVDQLTHLVDQFRKELIVPSPSLEYDFFFWLINHNKMYCVILHGERLWIDSIRDVNQLLTKTAHIE